MSTCPPRLCCDPFQERALCVLPVLSATNSEPAAAGCGLYDLTRSRRSRLGFSLTFLFLPLCSVCSIPGGRSEWLRRNHARVLERPGQVHRHHRRLQRGFLSLLHRVLRLGGRRLSRAASHADLASELGGG